MSRPDEPGPNRVIPTAEIGRRDRYQLLTSLLVPRPIGWVSSRSGAGLRNLAPFSYFAALAASPMLVGLSIGARKGSPKDTLNNIRETGAFCINIVSEEHLLAMNESAGEHPPDIDEFAVAGLAVAEAEFVAAPYVADCRAVFECRLHQQVDLADSGSVLVIGEVVAVRLAPPVEFAPGTFLVEPESLRPVARLGGDLYAFLGEIPSLPRPKLP